MLNSILIITYEKCGLPTMAIAIASQYPEIHVIKMKNTNKGAKT
jgi:hypothetical protein